MSHRGKSGRSPSAGVGYKHPPKRAVLLGRGRKQNSHSGNVLYRKALEQLVSARMEDYYGSSSSVKHSMAEAVAESLTKKGFRFMKQNKEDELWRYCCNGRSELTEKIKQAFRDRTKKIMKSHNSSNVDSKAADGNGHEETDSSIAKCTSSAAEEKVTDSTTQSVDVSNHEPSTDEAGAGPASCRDDSLEEPTSNIESCIEERRNVMKPTGKSPAEEHGQDATSITANTLSRSDDIPESNSYIKGRGAADSITEPSSGPGQDSKFQQNASNDRHGQSSLQRKHTVQNNQTCVAAAEELSVSVEQLMGQTQEEIDRYMSTFETQVEGSGLLGPRDPLALELRSRLQDLRTRHATEAARLTSEFRGDLEILCGTISEGGVGRVPTSCGEDTGGDHRVAK